MFFDEFPWFATARSDFLMAFGEFWNRYGTAEEDYLFVTCGSATSWIVGNVLENTGSLYNRVTCQIGLEPFRLAETELYLCEMKFTDKPFPISAEYESTLLNKVDVFRAETGTSSALKIVMVSAEGIAGVAHTERIARTLTLDDLFA